MCVCVCVFSTAKRKNVNCEKLQRKCNRGSSKACKKLAKLCSDFLRRQEDSSASSHVPAGNLSYSVCSFVVAVGMAWGGVGLGDGV